jgi:hypothetical protein
VDDDPKLETIAPAEAGGAVLRFFTREQFAALQRAGVLLMPPKSGVPGAIGAHAAEFLCAANPSLIVRKSIGQGSTRSMPRRAASTARHSQALTTLRPTPWWNLRSDWQEHRD